MEDYERREIQYIAPHLGTIWPVRKPIIRSMGDNLPKYMIDITNNGWILRDLGHIEQSRLEINDNYIPTVNVIINNRIWISLKITEYLLGYYRVHIEPEIALLKRRLLSYQYQISFNDGSKLDVKKIPWRAYYHVFAKLGESRNELEILSFVMGMELLFLVDRQNSP